MGCDGYIDVGFLPVELVWWIGVSGKPGKKLAEDLVVDPHLPHSTCHVGG